MKIVKVFVSGLLALMLVLYLAPARAAVNIDIDPGAYPGNWSITGFPGTHTGFLAVSVDPGPHSITVGTLLWGLRSGHCVDGAE